MKEAHPTTEKLLDRALEFLINTDIEKGSSICLNNKTYKEIIFSAQQVIDSMHELSIPGEVPLTSRSSIRDIKGKPNTYKQKIEQAKIKKITRNSTKSGFVSTSQRLSIAELTQENMTLIAQNNSLRNNIAALESFIAQAELEEKMEENQIKTNTFSDSSNKHKILLARLMEILFEDELLIASKASGKVQPSISIERLSGKIEKLCNLVEIKDLMNIKTDGSGKISIETK